MIDQLAPCGANEAKVGYTTLTKDVQLQILKDTKLLKTGAVNGAAWNFYTSPVTGRAGPSGPLV
ncbi:hypothetical protein [Cupriavidus sp. WS]|uniref:hypothetical protein n=1 Tax=Cupriavidus sp. WS TaxID=1312922 RepID=UPI0012DD6FF3|nr:hypothetical protein [Cupriavidus sp. WS]